MSNQIEEVQRSLSVAEFVRWMVSELDRLHTWDGLLSLVDEHYPADIFPTVPDREDRDTGPRLISALRELERQRVVVHLAKAWAHSGWDDEALDRLGGAVETLIRDGA